MELDVTKALLKPGEAFPFEAIVAVPPQDVDRRNRDVRRRRTQGTLTRRWTERYT